jgi:hypothetical protein
VYFQITLCKLLCIGKSAQTEDDELFINKF